MDDKDLKKYGKENRLEVLEETTAAIEIQNMCTMRYWKYIYSVFDVGAALRIQAEDAAVGKKLPHG